MKNKRYLLIVALIVCVLMMLSGCNLFSTEAKATYSDVEGGVALTKYEGNSSNKVLEIPAEYEEKPVVEIGEYAVAACEYLSDVVIGKNVKEISDRAFCGSNKIASFTVDENNPYFCSVDGVVFTKDKKTLVLYPNFRQNAEGKYEYEIPEGVETIRKCAFYMCNKLTKVTFSSTVKKVDEYAFFQCDKMEELYLNEGLVEVGRDGFSFSESLKSLTIPSTLEKIGDYGFYAKTSKLTPDTFITKRPLDRIEQGERWLPQATGMQNSKIEPTYKGGN